MENILKKVNLKSKLNNKYIMLFLDYDGTIVPIADEPDKAVISKETKNLLAELLKLCNFRLIIISGRDLKYIKKKIGLKNIIYTGNHGFEIEGPDIKFKQPVSIRYKTILKKIKNELKRKVAYVRGTFIEDKGLSLSLHYRLVDEKSVPLIKNIFHEITDSYSVKNDIKLRKGKKLLEVVPPVEWDKGKAVLWLLARQQFILKNNKILTIYLGDDLTDEDAFKVLKNKGIGVFVGKSNKKSYAKYYLKNPKEVKDFLIRLKEMLG